MGGNSSKPLSRNEIQKMINDGISKYASGCQKTMIATLVRNDGTIQELHCSGRARIFWLFVFGIISTVIYGTLLAICILGRLGILINKNRETFSDKFLVLTIIGFVFSIYMTINASSWAGYAYGQQSSWSKMMGYIYGQKKRFEDKSFSYDMFQPCNTRRTPGDCKNSGYTEVIPMNSIEKFNKLPKQFREKYNFSIQDGTALFTEKIPKQGKPPEIIKTKLMYVERQCVGTTKFVGKGELSKMSKAEKDKAKEAGVIEGDNYAFFCNVNKDLQGRVVLENNLRNTYDKNLKLLSCNRRESKNVCENIGGKSCEWVPKEIKNKDGSVKNVNVCKKKWKPFSGYDIWGCDECDDLSEFCTLSGVSWTGMFLLPICSILLLVLALDLDKRDDDDFDDTSNQAFDIIAIICYITSGILFLVGIAYTFLALFCPAGSDMFLQGVEDGEFYKMLWSSLI